jgi:hypothetical protein
MRNKRCFVFEFSTQNHCVMENLSTPNFESAYQNEGKEMVFFSCFVITLYTTLTIAVITIYEKAYTFKLG